ncbi:hypothetical protein ACFVGY_20065 [Streptomyces sp. NPDC127106]|uniref:hypothetical protein n=1 Tax=Streptomyces sp. NPDC127106 TaxID=3345360 RepID=UPI003629E743
MQELIGNLAVNAPYAVVAICAVIIAWLWHSAYTLRISLDGSQPPDRPAIIREHARMIRFWRRRP